MDAALIGKTVTVTIDRPIGSCHPNDPQMVYPINYGFVHGILASDGEEQDVYVLGVDKPVTEFTGEIIAVIHRLDDVEDKWVVAEKGRRFSASQIQKATEFQERYFKSEILMPQQEEHLNASLLGKCGFYCGACPTFLEGDCQGCMEAHRAGDCYSRDCVIRKGLSFCGECLEFPCPVILTRPHCTVLDKDWLNWKRRQKEGTQNEG